MTRGKGHNPGIEAIRIREGEMAPKEEAMTGDFPEIDPDIQGMIGPNLGIEAIQERIEEEVHPGTMIGEIPEKIKVDQKIEI